MWVDASQRASPTMARSQCTADRVQPTRASRNTNGPLRRYSNPQRCLIETCTRRDCQLPTHLTYKSPRLSSPNQGNASPRSPRHYPFGSPAGIKELPTAHEPSNCSLLYDSGSTLLTPHAENQPFEHEDLIAETGDLLFRFFCNGTASPPLVSSHLGAGPHSSKQAASTLASMEPMYRTTVIAFMKFCEIKEQISTDIFEDRLTCSLYTSLVQHCQHALEDPDENSIDLLILAVIAICLFDISAGRHEPLRIHRTGLAALTSKIGGHHNLGLSLAHALWADRLVATVLSQKPIYPGPSLPVSAVRPAIQSNYASHFENTRSAYIIRPDVLAACRDAGHLMDIIDVMEFNKSLTKDLPKGSSALTPSYDYFFFVRDAVEHRLVQMLASYTSYNWQEECTLLAAKIVQNIVASVENVPAVNLLLSTRIRQRIHDAFVADADQQSMIARHESNDIMLWILFASALPSNMTYAHQRWLQETISRTANQYFGRPVTWRVCSTLESQHFQYKHEQFLESIWSVLCRFIWCSELKPRFMEVCNDMSDWL